MKANLVEFALFLLNMVVVTWLALITFGVVVLAMAVFLAPFYGVYLLLFR